MVRIVQRSQAIGLLFLMVVWTPVAKGESSNDARRAQIVAEITGIHQALSTFTAQVTEALSARLKVAQDTIGRANAYRATLLQPLQVQAVNAVAAATNQATSFLAQQLSNALSYLAAVAKNNPAAYAQEYANATVWYRNLETQSRSWLEGETAKAKNWLEAQSAPVEAWHKSTVAAATAQYAADEAEARRQVAQATDAASARVTALQQKLNGMGAEPPASSCPFPVNAPMAACQLVGRPEGAFDVYVWIATASGRRGFRLLIPPRLANPAALVLDLHGFTQNSSIQRDISKLGSYAIQYGFVLAEPDGIEKSWNAGHCCGQAVQQNVDDVGFLRDIIRVVTASGAVSARHVFAVGLSNGGMMAQRLACEASNEIAAIATVLGPNSQYDSPGAAPRHRCTTQRPVPILMIYDSNDRCVPFLGGQGSCPVRTISAVQNFEVWSGINGCSSTERRQIGSNGSAVGYGNPSCAANAQVQMVVVAGSGHVWPGTNTGIQTTELVLQFFAHHPM